MLNFPYLIFKSLVLGQFYQGHYNFTNTCFFHLQWKSSLAKCAQTDSQNDASLRAFQSCCFMRSQHLGCIRKIYLDIFGFAMQAKLNFFITNRQIFYPLSVWKASSLKHWRNRCKAYLDSSHINELERGLQAFLSCQFFKQGIIGVTTQLYIMSLRGICHIFFTKSSFVMCFCYQKQLVPY